jgi:hypothetical protein
LLIWLESAQNKAGYSLVCYCWFKLLRSGRKPPHWWCSSPSSRSWCRENTIVLSLQTDELRFWITIQLTNVNTSQSGIFWLA